MGAGTGLLLMACATRSNAVRTTLLAIVDRKKSCVLEQI